jgi:signal transduction histidine kinase/CheY-like chemotaxis protein
VDVKKRRKKTFHHSVRILALFIFTYHLLGEVVRMVTKPGYAVTGGTNIIKAAAFGAIGLIAAGVFRDEMENSEKLEKLVQERTAKLLEQARHLQRVEMEAQKKEALAAAMRESMEILSHELRTPLQGIMGMTSLLLDSEDVSQKGKESLTLVMVSSRLLLTLINNMLDVRKCDANMMNGFQLQPISVADPLLDAINYCQPLGLISNVTIDLIRNQALERAVVISNRLRLQQVCINLISNAIKHSPPGKSVKVICEVRSLEQVAFLLSTSIAHGSPFESNGTNAGIANNVLLISVSDSCEGIDVNLGHRVFQKFSQLSTEKNVTGKDTSFDLQPSGTGLGLNLCLKFVQRMNGNIWASSKKDGGACFSFYVPLVEDSIVDALSLQNSRKGFDCKDGKDPSCELTSHHPFSIGLRAPSRRKFDFSSVRALVVDDAIINLKVLACMLRRFNLRSVETVDSGAKALAMLEKQQFDLVITDIQMPKMSGLQLCENICANASFDNQKPVLVGWTAEINENLDQLCRISGMVTVLHKPLTAYQLQNLLETFFAPT